VHTSDSRLRRASPGWFIGPALATLVLFGSGVAPGGQSARAQSPAGLTDARPQMLTLSAKPATTVRAGTKVTLTARIGRPPKIKGYYIDIGDLSTGATLATCKPPKCTAVVRYTKPARHAYVALVAERQKGLLGQSSLIFISWKKK
jgi:hypothetical protein